MKWSVLDINYIDSPSIALSTEIQITSVVADYLRCFPEGEFFKCPISVMDRYSFQVQVFFPPELEVMALCFGAIATQRPDFCGLRGMQDMYISPIGLDVSSPYFQSLFVKHNQP
ncbi:TPA: hypothetical protein ACX6QL_002040 [Photobacterium damselae]